MKNFPKAGLLIITLVIPALIFVFLRFFARNHYDLPYFNAEKNAAGEILIQNGDTIFHKVQAEILMSEGAAFTGKLTVINYLPAQCNDTCKLALSQLQRISVLHSEIPSLQVLTISSEPRSKSEIQGVDGKGWKLLAPNSTDIAGFFRKEIGVNTNEPESVSDLFILIDTKGFVRGYYQGTNPKEIDRLMAEIKILAYEGEETK